MTPEQQRILAQANQVARLHTALRDARAALGDAHPLAAKIDAALGYSEPEAAEDVAMAAMLLRDALYRDGAEEALGAQWLAHATALAAKWGA